MLQFCAEAPPVPSSTSATTALLARLVARGGSERLDAEPTGLSMRSPMLNILAPYAASRRLPMRATVAVLYRQTFGSMDIPTTLSGVTLEQGGGTQVWSSAPFNRSASGRGGCPRSPTYGTKNLPQPGVYDSATDLRTLLSGQTLSLSRNPGSARGSSRYSAPCAGYSCARGSAVSVYRPRSASLKPVACRSMCGWMENGILAALPTLVVMRLKPGGLIGAPARS